MEALALLAAVTLTWQNPVFFENGDPLDPADIVSHRVQWTGDCPGFGYVANNLVVPGNAESMLVENITPGRRCFRVFVTARTTGCNVTAAESCLRESPASELWERVFAADEPEPQPEPEPVAAKVPMAPTNLSGN